MSEQAPTATLDPQAQQAPQVLDAAAAKPQLAFAALMPRVTAEHGKSLGAQIRDLVGLTLRNNRLSVDEYYHMELYDDALYDAAAKKRFVGLARSRKIWAALEQRNRFVGLFSDKLMFERTLRAFGIPMPTTLAVMGGHYPGAAISRIGTGDDLHAFLAEAAMPIFAKPIDSLQSLGSVRIEGYGASNRMISVSNGTVVGVEDFIAEVRGKFGGNYLFQTCVERHPVFAEMTGGGLSTIRIVVLDRGEGPEVWRCAAKLTSPSTVADNFWRAGNLLAPVDVPTGKLGKALTQMGIDGEFLSHHQDTGKQIEGIEVPFWAEAQEMVKAAMRLFPNVSMLGFDVAITPDGPLIIEANHDPHLIMMQIAHREGALDDTMQATLAHAAALSAAKQAEIKTSLQMEHRDRKTEMSAALSRR